MSSGKILLCCNNEIAIPALRELLFYEQVDAVIVPARNKEVIIRVNELIANATVELIEVRKSNYEKLVQDAIGKYKPEAVLLMTFPYITPPSLFQLPPKGFINFHYGKLPEYRGPEPIFSQIANGEKNPGLTVHVVTEKVDAGPIILQDTITSDENDTYNLVREKLAVCGAKLTNLLMKIFSFGKILPVIPQDESKANFFPKPGIDEVMINFQTMDSYEIKCLVNACNPWNKGCGLKIGDQVFGVLEVEIKNNGNSNFTPGKIVSLDPENGFTISTKDDKLIKINIVYNSLTGFISGHRVGMWGIHAGFQIN